MWGCNGDSGSGLWHDVSVKWFSVGQLQNVKRLCQVHWTSERSLWHTITSHLSDCFKTHMKKHWSGNTEKRKKKKEEILVWNYSTYSSTSHKIKVQENWKPKQRNEGFKSNNGAGFRFQSRSGSLKCSLWSRAEPLAAAVKPHLPHLHR